MIKLLTLLNRQSGIRSESSVVVATRYAKTGRTIKTFFAWWKQHLKVYHLILRSRHGLMVQMLAGLITYLLLGIYCHEQHSSMTNRSSFDESANCWLIRFSMKQV
jgi:hypothetical protein